MTVYLPFARVLILLGILSFNTVNADEFTVAVATNFAVTFQALADDFSIKSGHRIIRVSGSTGSLYAQITHGAPYDLLLAADTQRPALLAKQQGTASPFSYAIGRLVFWSADAERFDSGQQPDFNALNIRSIALANPDLAPYGLAALQTMTNLGLQDLLQGRLVTGENIGQTYALIDSGNADTGFIALSQLSAPDASTPKGSYWLVDAQLYDPIVQQGIILQHGAGKPAVTAFVEYLQSPAAKSLIQNYGYLTE